MIGRLLHAAVFAFQTVRRSIWFFTQPEAIGVHGVALTPEGNVVLVMLSYAPGWRLPGGGKAKGEELEAAMLRELREEIGMTAFESIESVTSFAHRPDRRHGNGTLFVVRGVLYRPRWSLEVKRVAEFNLDDLPRETARIARQLIAMAIG